jgi:protein ImuB
MGRVLCAWFPDWPVQRRTAEQPGLDGRAVAVAGEVRGCEIVTACSAAARSLGVRPGMPVAEAKSQTRGDELVLQRDDAEADREALGALADEGVALSPLVAVEEVERPECVFADVTGCALAFGGEEKLAEAALELWRRWTVRLAIADTAGAAWALAKGMSGAGKKNTSPLAGEVAAERRVGGAVAQRQATAPPTGSQARHLPHKGGGFFGGSPRSSSNAPHASSISPHSELRTRKSELPSPSTSLVVASTDTAAALAPLPIHLLRIDAEAAASLQKLGVSTIGGAERLPKAELDVRFGPLLKLRLDQAFGRAKELLKFRPYRTILEKSCSFTDPIDSAEWVLRATWELIAQVLAEIPDPDGILELDLRLTRERAPAAAAKWTFPAPTRDAKHLRELIALRLERFDRAGAVTGIHLSATVVGERELRQDDLFGIDDSRDREQARQALLERLASRLGRDAVLQPKQEADPQPEHQCSFVPTMAARGKKKTLVKKKPRKTPPKNTSPLVGVLNMPALTLGHPAPRKEDDSKFDVERWRPLVLLPRPQTIEVEPGEGPPMRIRRASRWVKSLRAWGPERLQTGEWRGRPIDRDYFRVVVSTGSRWWIFRDRRSARWFLHGCFA